MHDIGLRTPRTSLRGLWVCACSLCATLASSAAAQTAPDTSALTLRWEAPPTCPSADAIQGRVHRLLGDDARGLHVAAHAVAWRGEDALWHVQIRTQTSEGSGERNVDGESCAAIADATALILALAIDPEAVAARAEGLEPAPVAAAATAALEPVPTPVPLSLPSAIDPLAPPAPLPAYPTPHSTQSTLPIILAPVAGLEVGALPEPAFVWGAVLATSWSRSRVQARAWVWSEQSTTLESRPGSGGSFDLLTVGLDACHTLLGVASSVDACAGLEGGSMQARGFGVTDPGKASPAWLALTPGLVGRWTLGSSLALRLDAGAAIPLLRPRFILDPYGSAHRAAPVTGRIAFGPELTFP